jgi:hypothetical protein
VSKPSVNEPKIGLRTSQASSTRPCVHNRRARLTAASGYRYPGGADRKAGCYLDTGCVVAPIAACRHQEADLRIRCSYARALARAPRRTAGGENDPTAR